MATDEVESIQAIVNIKKEGSITGALTKVKGKEVNKQVNDIHLPPSDMFCKVLKRAGVTEKQLAQALADLLQAKRVSVDRNGQIHESPDNPVRLKTIELLLKYFVPDNTPAQNHLHLHGKKLDELLSKDIGT